MTSRRRLALVLGIGTIAIAIVSAVLWWNERTLQTVEQMLQKGDAAGALAAVEKYLERSPGHSEAVALRARALVAVGRVEEARVLFEQAGAAGPEDLRAWSTAMLHQGDWEHALPVLERLLQVDSQNPETLEAIAVCQYELGRYQEAIATATRLASLAGHEARGEFQIASIYRASGHATLANQHFAKVLQHSPDASGLDMAQADFFLAYAESLLGAGDARKALEMLDRSSQLAANPLVLLRQADAWQAIGKLDSAQQALEQIAKQAPMNRIVREHLAEIALQQKDPKRALSWLKPLLEGDEMSLNLAYLLQRTYTDLGEESLAEQWQEKTATLRREAKQSAALQSEAQKDPQSPRAKLIVAYQSAAARNWQLAGQQLAALLRQTPEAFEEPFVQQLAGAIRERGKLPPIEQLPKKARTGEPQWR